MSDIVKDQEAKMKKSLENTQKVLASLRTGRASPQILDGITVEYYGSSVPLKQLATITVPEPRQLLLQPFDKSAAGEIEKAIQKSDLGIQPRQEGGMIRLILPQPTEERRKELVKVARKSAEEGKVAVRNIRREGLDSLKKDEESKTISQDAHKQLEDRIQKLTDKFTKEIDEMLKGKEQEILTL